MDSKSAKGERASVLYGEVLVMKHEMFKVVGFVEKESVKDERKLWG